MGGCKLQLYSLDYFGKIIAGQTSLSLCVFVHLCKAD